jgi:hypothetical protein
MRELDQAATNIEIEGDRYPAELDALVGREAAAARKS